MLLNFLLTNNVCAVEKGHILAVSPVEQIGLYVSQEMERGVTEHYLWSINKLNKLPCFSAAQCFFSYAWFLSTGDCPKTLHKSLLTLEGVKGKDRLWVTALIIAGGCFLCSLPGWWAFVNFVLSALRLFIMDKSEDINKVYISYNNKKGIISALCVC